MFSRTLLLCWTLSLLLLQINACVFPSTPLYNPSRREYVACSPSRFDCPPGYVCFPVRHSEHLSNGTNGGLHVCCSDSLHFNEQEFVVATKERTISNNNRLAYDIPQTLENLVQQGRGKIPAFQPTTRRTTRITQTRRTTSRRTTTRPTTTTTTKAPTTTTELPTLAPRTFASQKTEPIVMLMVEGYLYKLPGLIQSKAFRKAATITLIQDGSLNILVDSGLAKDEQLLLRALNNQGIEPSDIHLLIVTHGHPDHYGNQNLFSAVQIMWDNYFSKQDEVITNGLSTFNQTTWLTPNIQVIRTPGHTEFSNSVRVDNVMGLGSVVISGDTFMNSNDFDSPSLWTETAWNASVQLQSRKLLLCGDTDYIIPGHGSTFKVTRRMRQLLQC